MFRFIRELVGVALIAIIGGMSSIWFYTRGAELCRAYSWCAAATGEIITPTLQATCITHEQADSIYFLAAGAGGTDLNSHLADFHRNLAARGGACPKVQDAVSASCHTLVNNLYFVNWTEANCAS
jgi:hypothetical protein